MELIFSLVGLSIAIIVYLSLMQAKKNKKTYTSHGSLLFETEHGWTSICPKCNYATYLKEFTITRNTGLIVERGYNCKCGDFVVTIEEECD